MRLPLYLVRVPVQDELSASSVNHLRAYIRAAVNAAIGAGHAAAAYAGVR